MEYWVSNSKMTIWVKTNSDNIIIDCAPVIRKFKKQPFKNLINWLQKFSNVDYKILKEIE